jgi:hypothetical protein
MGRVRTVMWCHRVEFGDEVFVVLGRWECLLASAWMRIGQSGEEMSVKKRVEAGYCGRLYLSLVCCDLVECSPT